MSSTIRNMNIVTKQKKITKFGIISVKNLIKIILIAVLLTILETTALSLLRKFYILNKNAIDKSYKYLWLPLMTWFIYGIIVLLIYLAYGSGNISLINAVWNTGTNTIVPLVGVMLFGESLTKYGWVGLLTSTIGGIILGLAQTNII